MITSSIRGNKKFPETDFGSRVTKVLNCSDELDRALRLPAGPGKSVQVQGARVALEMALGALGSEVQSMVNQVELNYEDRLALVREAGMEVRQNKGPGKRVFSVKHGKMKGSAICYAARQDAVSHEWQMAPDITNLETRLSLPATVRSMTEITGLKTGQEYAFYHRPVVTGGIAAWEGPIFLTVI